MRKPIPAPDLRPCPCGADRKPQRVNLYPYRTRTHLRVMRCPDCGLTSGLGDDRPHKLAHAWNEAVRDKLGEALPKPADWVDIAVIKTGESGLDWGVEGKDGLHALVSKSKSQLERVGIGEKAMLSLPIDYARRLGLMA
jgi:hypothetical protein